MRPTCTRLPQGEESECQCGAEEGEIEAAPSANDGVIEAADQSTAQTATAATATEATEATNATLPTSTPCHIIPCDFERFDLCGWRDLSDSQADFRRLIVAQRRAGAAPTNGIPDAVDGEQNASQTPQPSEVIPLPTAGRRYVISRIGAGGRVGMLAEGVQLSESLVMRLEIFRTAEALDVKICLDAIDNCVSSENATAAQWQLNSWQQTYVSLPQNTTKVWGRIHRVIAIVYVNASAVIGRALCR